MSPERARMFRALILPLLLLAGVCVVSIACGSASIAPGQLWRILADPASFAGSAEYDILFKLRLPRIVLALAVGGGLSLAGVLLQRLFNNPLVEPFTLGISGGAALAVCLGVVLGVHRIFPGLFPVLGFAGGLGTLAGVFYLSCRGGALGTQRLLLTGVMFSFISASLIMLMLALARAEDLQGILFWTMGSLDNSSWPQILLVLGLTLTVLAAAFLRSPRLNALALGEEPALHLGVATDRLKRFLFLCSALLAGSCVAVSGMIGFVGLAVPQFMRLLVGNDARMLLGASFLGGAAFLVLCDTLARTLIAPVELPVGIITGILGGIVFIFTLARSQVK